MAKEKAWYADSAVGTLLADLFEGKWSPELLAQLAQIPLAEAERGAFPGCPPSSGTVSYTHLTSANGRHYYLVCAHELENRH